MLQQGDATFARNSLLDAGLAAFAGEVYMWKCRECLSCMLAWNTNSC